MLVGFAVGCAVIHATVGGPLAGTRPAVDMAVRLQPGLASPSKFMQRMQPMKSRASSVIANAESLANPGRRQMMAGAFGLAVAVTNRAARAAEDERFDKVFGETKPVEEKLPAAGDYTQYDSVVTIPGFEPNQASKQA